MNQPAAELGETRAGALADAIRLERHRQRKKQAEVARSAGLAQATVSEAENGRASLEAFQAIATALGIDLPEVAP